MCTHAVGLCSPHFVSAWTDLSNFIWTAASALFKDRTPTEDAVVVRKLKDAGAVDIPDGGRAIPYYMEDPFLREEFEGMLAKVGRKSDMDPRLYTENIKADFVGV